jgi:outer membrane protein assembly factor BamB
VARRGGGWMIEAAGSSNELVADDRTACGTNQDDLLFCLEGATGDEIFSEQLVERPQAFSIVDRTLLVGDHTSNDGSSLLAYSLDGERLWEAPLEQLTPTAPPVAGGVVAVLPDIDAELVGLDLATGEERWQTSLTSSTRDLDSVWLTGPVFTDGQSFYVTTTPLGSAGTGSIVAIDARSGTERWRTDVDRLDLPPRAAAPFDDGTAIAFVVGALGQQRRIVVLDTATGQLRWEAPLTAAAATVAHIDDVMVALSGAELRGYSADGDELWTTDAPTGFDDGAVNSAAAADQLLLGRLFVADGVIYFHSSHVYTIDPSTGESRTVIDDRVGSVVATADHLVYADICCPIPPHIRGHPL